MELNITSKSNPFGDTTAENDKKVSHWRVSSGAWQRLRAPGYRT